MTAPASIHWHSTPETSAAGAASMQGNGWPSGRSSRQPRREATLQTHSSADRALIQRLQAIETTTRAINSALDLDELLDVILNEAQKLTGAERGTVYVVDREAGEIISVVTEGGETLRIALPLGKGFAGLAATTGETINIENAYDDPRFNPEVDRATGFRTHSVLTMPIRNQDEVIVGVIQLLNKVAGRFTREDEELIETFGVHASIAIERTRTAEALIRNRSLAAVGNLAASIIHDLKSPLQVIQGYVDLLNFTVSGEEQQQQLSQIGLQLGRMVGMTQEVIDFARGQIKLKPEETALVPFLREHLHPLQGELARRQIDVQLVLDVDNDFTAILDRGRFARVLQNLVGNARDAMAEGGTLTVELAEEAGRWRLRVSDTGCGIAPGRLESIFEPFSTHGKANGTGLGLTIARNVVREHGGEIEVQSTAGEGTTFNITMPVQPSLPAFR